MRQSVNRSRRVRFGHALVWVIGLVGGCSPQFATLRVAAISDVQVARIDRDGFDMVVVTRVENPNRLSAEVSDIRFVASIGEHVLGRGTVPGVVHAAAQSAFDIEAAVRVRFADLPADLPARIADGVVPLTVLTDMTAQTRVGEFDMTVRADGDTEIAASLPVMVRGALSAPVVQVAGVRSFGAGIGSITLRVQTRLRNAFPFPIRIKRGQVSLYLGEGRAGSSTFDVPFTLRPYQRSVREFELTITHGDLFRTLRALISGELGLRARGSLDIEPIGGVSRVPFDVLVDSAALADLL